MAKKINEKTAGISLAGFQPRSQGGSIEAPPPAPPALVDRMRIKPLRLMVLCPPLLELLLNLSPALAFLCRLLLEKMTLQRSWLMCRPSWRNSKELRLLDFWIQIWFNQVSGPIEVRQSFKSTDFENLKSEIESAGGNVQPIKVRPLSRCSWGI
jgi:hypothetical protein